jgi:hypothetical protein
VVDSDEAMHSALASPEMAAAVEDARAFLDMDQTGLVIVEETPIMTHGRDRPGGSSAPDKEQADEDRQRQAGRSVG